MKTGGIENLFSFNYTTIEQPIVTRAKIVRGYTVLHLTTKRNLSHWGHVYISYKQTQLGVCYNLNCQTGIDQKVIPLDYIGRTVRCLPWWRFWFRMVIRRRTELFWWNNRIIDNPGRNLCGTVLNRMSKNTARVVSKKVTKRVPISLPITETSLLN